MFVAYIIIYIICSKILDLFRRKSQKLFLEISEKFREYSWSLNRVKKNRQSAAKSNPWLVVEHLGQIISQGYKHTVTDFP